MLNETELKFCKQISEGIETAWFEELDAKKHVAQQEAAVLLNAVLDGKNAEARKLQADDALKNDKDYQDLLEASHMKEAWRRGLETYAGLVKAMLYSKGGC